MAGEVIQASKVLKIGVRVEFFLESDDTKYTSRIENITSDGLVVAMPVDEKRRPIIPRQGERLYAYAVGEACRYQFFSIFKDKGMDTIPVWYITTPETVKRHQNRMNVRVEMSIPLHLRIINQEGKQGDVIETMTSDLSGSGVSFVLPSGVPVNHKAVLEFHNIPEIGTLNIMARIVRSLPLVPKERGYRIGAQFLDLSRPHQNSLIRFIFAHMRKQLALGIQSEAD